MMVSLLSSENHLADEEKNSEIVGEDFQLGFVLPFVWAKYQRARAVPILPVLGTVALPAAT